MAKRPTFLAVIPARCGSKGLPGKNIMPLHGKPLIAWSIDAALSSRYISDTVVSSDCEEILSVARKYNALALKRPKELALDSSPSEPLITHAIESLEKEGRFYDFVVLLQPTSPLRDSKDIDNAIESMLNKRGNASISVYEPSHSPFKAFVTKENGFLKGIVDDDKPFMRRQDLPSVYLTNGAIYIVSTEMFLKTQRLFTDKTVPYVMPIEKSIDIDTIDDFEVAEKALEKSDRT